MPSQPTTVLVLCTENSCRFIMAEALINHLGQGHNHAFSAGSHPTGKVHPLAIATLKRHGIDPSHAQSQSWHDMTTQPFNLIITVCDQAAEEPCPIFPGQQKKFIGTFPTQPKRQELNTR